MYTLVYSINEEKYRKTVYVNLTNSCTNNCVFCLRTQKDDVCGAKMWHDEKFTLEDIIEQFKKFIKIDENGTEIPPKEVVFCGYGEPLLRKEMVKAFSKYLRQNYPQIKTRINTNGHANAIYKTNVAEELKGLIDYISISLNASNETEYDEICKPKIPNAYEEVKKFIQACVEAGMEVSTSIVTGFDKIHNIDIEECKRISTDLGAKFRNREYITNGY